MKTILASLAAVLLLTACGGEGGGSPGAGNNPVDAPTDYLKSTVKAQKSAVKTVDTAAITRAIQMFEAQEGRSPSSLEELVEKKFLPEMPRPPAGMKFLYDARNGTVKVVPE